MPQCRPVCLSGAEGGGATGEEEGCMGRKGEGRCWGGVKSRGREGYVWRLFEGEEEEEEEEDDGYS